MWGIKLKDLFKLFTDLIFYVFDLQQPQWSDIGGQNGGQIVSSFKYIMWGIKLEDLILQAYKSHLQT